MGQGASLAAIIALIGPPGVGKSTVSLHAVTDYDAGVFRLREFAQVCRAAGWMSDDQLSSSDQLGWFSDNAVDILLAEAFLRGRFPSKRLVLCESFPGTGEQVHSLRRVAQLHGAQMSIIELDADDDVLWARVSRRRVCGNCEPTVDGQPHRPARTDPQNVNRCGRCHQALIRRRSDDLETFARRLARYRHRSPGIHAAAASFAIPYHRIDATTTTESNLVEILSELMPVGPTRCMAATRRSGSP